MVFGSEKINQAIAQLEEKTNAHAATLQDIQNALKQRIDRPGLEARLKEFDDALTKKVDASQAEWEKKLHDMEGAVQKLVTQESALESQLAEAAQEGKTLREKKDALESRELELEKKVEQLISAVNTKADCSRVEDDERLLKRTQEALASLEQQHASLVISVDAKASAADLDVHRKKLTKDEQALASFVAEVNANLARRPDIEHFQAELQRLDQKFSQHLDLLTERFNAEHAEVSSALARRADLAAFQEEQASLRDTHAELVALKQEHALRHRDVLDSLVLKAERTELFKVRDEHADWLRTCAIEERVSSKLKQHQEQITLNSSLISRHHDQHVAALAKKLERDDFEKRWSEDISGEIRSEIQAQRDQLTAALEKKDELIALAEGMQSDLTCALALRGRGPPRLGPLVRNTPRKQLRKDASDAHMAAHYALP